MIKKILICLFIFLSGCGKSIEDEFPKPIPLIVKMRIQVPQSTPNFNEKYFASPLRQSLKCSHNIARIHSMAYEDKVVSLIIFERDIPFHKASKMLQGALQKFKFVQPGTVELTELELQHLPQEDLFQVAALQGIRMDHLLPTQGIRISSYIPAINKVDKLKDFYGDDCVEKTPPPQHSPTPIFILDNIKGK